MLRKLLAALIVLLPAFAAADGPADNIPTNVRRIPKLGIEVPADRRAKLEAGLARLGQSIDKLREATKTKSPPHSQLAARSWQLLTG